MLNLDLLKRQLSKVQRKNQISNADLKKDCSCGSGLPFKYCHLRYELRERSVFILLNRVKQIWAFVDLKNDLLNIASTEDLPLKYFCKDNGFYFFNFNLTIGHTDYLYNLLKNKSLTKEIVFDTFKKNCIEFKIMNLKRN